MTYPYYYSDVAGRVGRNGIQYHATTAQVSTQDEAAEAGRQAAKANYEATGQKRHQVDVMRADGPDEVKDHNVVEQLAVEFE